MPYIYSEQRHFTFTPEGQEALCVILVTACEQSRVNGIVTHKQLDDAAYVSDSWHKLAVIDRLVELGYLQVVGREGVRQHWVYRWMRERA